MARTASQAPDFPVRLKAAVAVAALFSLWGAIQFHQFEADLQKQSPDPYRIGAQSTRLEEIKASLPENVTIGYLSDAPASSLVDLTMFNAARYTLAPRLVQRDTAHDRALGNFTKPADYAGIGRAHGLAVERDFGNGVVLFRREGAR